MRSWTRITHSRGFGIVTRMVERGGIMGAVLGALYPLLAVGLIQLLKLLFGTDAGSANWTMLNIWMAVGCPFGLAIGGIAGLVLGFVVGGALAALTHTTPNPGSEPRRYIMAAQLACIVVGGPVALLMNIGSGLPQIGSNGWGGEWGWLVWGLAPALVATIAAWWAGRRVAMWVIATAPKSI